MKRTPPPLDSIQRVLIIKKSALGDIAKALPAVEALHFARPQIEIGWVVKRGLDDLLQGNPAINRIYPVSRGMKAVREVGTALRRFAPDVVLDMQGLFVSGCLSRCTGAKWRCTWASNREMSGLLTGNPIIDGHDQLNNVEALFEFVRELGVTGLAPEPPAYLVADEPRINKVETMMMGAPLPRVGMHVGASVANKVWPARHFAALADLLMDRGIGVVFFGGPGEAASAEEAEGLMRHKPVSLVGKTTPRELATAISRCQVFVGGDTGATHIASLVRTPTVALMGATLPVRDAPYGGQHSVIHLGLSCSPCFRRPTCEGRYDCMTGIQPELVLKECLQKIAASKAAEL